MPLEDQVTMFQVYWFFFYQWKKIVSYWTNITSYAVLAVSPVLDLQI